MAFKMKYNKGGFPFKKDTWEERYGKQVADKKAYYEDKFSAGRAEHDKLIGKKESVIEKDSRKVRRAKRKIRKADKLGAVGGDFSKNERQFLRGERKRDKAVDLLVKAGYSDMQIEEATGSDGRRVAMDWATKSVKRKRKRKK
jgi:hypothetical protein